MSSSAPKSVFFLIDENVKADLHDFLAENFLNARLVPKGISDVKIAEISKLEKRVLVTNDTDFLDPTLHPKDTLFAVIVLRIPQSDTKTLLEAFSSYVLGKTSDELQGRAFELSERGLTSK